MNELQARLSADMKTALKAGDKARLQTIRLMIAALQDARLQGASDAMPLDAEHDVLRKMVKARRDAIEQAEAAGRSDVAEREAAEIAVIQEYLPAAMAPDELRARVREVAAAIGYAGPKDKGRFMKEWMARYKGRAEGRDVQAALDDLAT